MYPHSGFGTGESDHRANQLSDYCGADSALVPVLCAIVPFLVPLVPVLGVRRSVICALVPGSWGPGNIHQNHPFGNHPSCEPPISCAIVSSPMETFLLTVSEYGLVYGSKR